jgi:hypothetical protein
MAHSPRRSARLARRTSLMLTLTWVASAALVGCGGGGGGGDEPATPVVAPSGNVDVASFLPLRTNVVDADGAFQAQRLVVMDPATGQAVWQQFVSPDSTQQGVRAFTVSSGGLAVAQGRHMAWFYSDRGKLFGVDLAGTTPSVRQVSSETAVCEVTRAEPTDGSATSSWLLLRTGGADGRCDTPEDDARKIVRSDAGSGTAALAWAGGQLEPLAVHRDASGQLTQLLAYDAATARLLVVSAADGSATPVVGGTLTEGASVAWIGRAAGRRDQVYLAVELPVNGQVTPQTQLRTLTWGSDTAAPTLGSSSLLSLSSMTPVFAQTDDARGFYLFDGGKVYTIARGASAAGLLAEFKPLQVNTSSKVAAPAFAGGAMTSSTLVVPSLELTGAVLNVINKDTGLLRQVALPGESEAPYAVEAHAGDRIVISRPDGLGGAVRPLWQADVSGTSTIIPVTLISDTARVIVAPRNDVASLGGEAEQSAIVWCDAAQACTAATVQSLQLSSGASLSLASADAADFEWLDHSAGANAGNRAAVSISSQNDVGLWASDSAWLLDATQAGSLKQVILP